MLYACLFLWEAEVQNQAARFILYTEETRFCSTQLEKENIKRPVQSEGNSVPYVWDEKGKLKHLR